MRIKDNKFHEVVRIRYGILIVIGNSTNFWDNEWIDGFILKSRFPRIYALAGKKLGVVSEFQVWVDDYWQWDVHPRKNLFGWEVSQGNEFFNLLNSITLSREHGDKIIWKPYSHGKYNVKSFGRSI